MTSRRNRALYIHLYPFSSLVLIPPNRRNRVFHINLYPFSSLVFDLRLFFQCVFWNISIVSAAMQTRAPYKSGTFASLLGIDGDKHPRGPGRRPFKRHPATHARHPLESHHLSQEAIKPPRRTQHMVRCHTGLLGANFDVPYIWDSYFEGFPARRHGRFSCGLGRSI